MSFSTDATAMVEGMPIGLQREFSALIVAEIVAELALQNSFTRSAPTTGATITMATGERRRVIDPAGTIAALTVVLPASPADGAVAEIMTSQIITALTVNAPGGATTNGGALTPAADSGASWLYRAANTTWYRRY
jgi:hypothetical protein